MRKSFKLVKSINIYNIERFKSGLDDTCEYQIDAPRTCAMRCFSHALVLLRADLGGGGRRLKRRSVEPNLLLSVGPACCLLITGGLETYLRT